MDAGRFKQSVLLDATYGFGGNGRSSDGCITDGPFSNYTNVIGPGTTNTPHCINRAINEKTSSGANQTNIDKCLKSTTYAGAWPCLEGTPHGAGHGGIGGEVRDPGDLK
jgi:tyrosinase